MHCRRLAYVAAQAAAVGRRGLVLASLLAVLLRVLGCRHGMEGDGI